MTADLGGEIQRLRATQADERSKVEAVVAAAEKALQIRTYNMDALAALEDYAQNTPTPPQ